jgi:hypothetical protein
MDIITSGLWDFTLARSKKKTFSSISIGGPTITRTGYRNIALLFQPLSRQRRSRWLFNMNPEGDTLLHLPSFAMYFMLSGSNALCALVS